MRIQILQPILFGGSLVMLFILWLFVFRPMEKHIKENIDKLAKQLEALNKFMTNEKFEDYETKTNDELSNVNKIRD